MIKTSIEKLASEIGYDIGQSDDVTQSNLLNGLFEAMNNSMQNHNLEMQYCYLTKHLSDKSCKSILAIAEFIKLKNE